MTRSIAAIAATAFLLGAAAGVLLTRTSDREVAEANARAAVLASDLEAAKTLADNALGAHRRAAAERDSLRATRAAAVGRLRTSRPVPAPCDTVVREVLVAAERVIAIDSARIVVLETDNRQLAEPLAGAGAALREAQIELTQQARRTEKAPRKLLGLLPRPELTLGYGATHLDGRLRHGPQLTLGFKVPL